MVNLKILKRAALGLLLLFGGCLKQPASEKLTIVATTSIIADALSNLVDTHAVVFSLMGPDVDPHLYKPTPKDLRLLKEADIIFYNGLHLEGKMQEVLQSLKKKKDVIAVTEALPSQTLIATGVQTYDPHVWFSVPLWGQCVQYMAKTLAKKDPKHQNIYLSRAEQYLEALFHLHQWIQDTLKTIPPHQRILITAHDAFGYFGITYDVEVYGLQGISTASDFGLKDIERLTNLILTRKIKAIFVESSVSQRGINAVIEACKQQGWEVCLGGTLYSDALGAPTSNADTYIKMVRHNVRTLVTGLTQGCNVRP